MKLFSSRYEEIKEKISELLMDYGINTIPIDVFDLAKRMKISVAKYSDFPDNEQIVLLNGSIDGISYYDDNLKEFRIIYNDSRIHTRIRFTIAHEIGHIVLGHKETKEENESEADFFARSLLVPIPIVLYKGIDIEEIIMEEFDVSYYVACIVSNNIKSRLDSGHKGLKDYEKELLKQFNLYAKENWYDL